MQLRKRMIHVKIIHCFPFSFMPLNESTEGDFCRDIADHPDDPQCRLVFADWLEQQGDVDRSRLIRLEAGQIQPDQFKDSPDVLRAKAETAWRARFALLNIPVSDIEWRSGVPTRCAMSPEAFLSHGAGLINNTPVRKVKFFVPDIPIALLSQSPLLGKLREINFGACALQDADIRDLAASPHLGSVRRLSLYGNTITEAGVRALGQSTSLSALESLDLSQNRIGDSAMLELARGPAFGGLKYLSLAHNDVGNSGVAAFAGSSNADSLLCLDLSYNRVGDDGAIQIANSVHLRQLRSLRLHGNQIGSDGVSALANKGGLRSLDLIDDPHDERSFTQRERDVDIELGG